MKDKILKKNLPVIIVSTLVLVLGIVGLTLALTNGMSSNVVIDTANLGVEYSGNLTLPSTNLFPIEDSEIDSNTENVLTVTFTVKGVQSNPTDIPIIYDIVLSDLDVPEELKSEYLKWQLKKNGTVISTGSFSKDFDTIIDGRLTLTEIQQDLPSYNSTADSYEFKLWISESCPGNDMSQCGPEQDQSNMLNKTLSGKIEAILYTKSKQALVRKPDLSRTSSEMLEYLGLTSKGVKEYPISETTTSEENGIWETEDDYGTSYYFRGNINNNNIVFAGFNWKILRINGNGSLRLALNYSCAKYDNENYCIPYALNYAYDNEDENFRYVGYMHGISDLDNIESSNENIFDSTIKIALDNWYEENIVNNGFSEKVENDTIYCNDRSVYNIENDFNPAPGGGVGDSSTKVTYNYKNRILQQNPILTCPQIEKDGFSVNNASKGNQKLKYPIATITADEVAYAGTNGYLNNVIDYNNVFYTMTPLEVTYRSDSNRSLILSIMKGDSYSYLAFTGTFFEDTYQQNILPVLSLKSDITVTGTGTQNDPFVVQ